MGYLTNYEPYTSQSQSFDLKRRTPSEEVISPLRTLYPHVAALQIRSDANAGYFTGYQDTGYWADAYTTQPPGEDYSRPMTGRRHSGEY
ncbi:hypothetical protein ASPWEDRAFT_173492 [Aspergillus wentii DTO 134E9]|uniref:Uncharacterized protein n=1 Tax=Aspergillus wentii DTO 134E9 TaxID=1073089 RepID=A0A1L9RGR9_ASPWE|nr:uncharacterized protein ASPWEDRAFT_173492 [Aspergillus wentii DTO 134E9]KAI9927842.1 hypothetical protein MW887_002694 [Aspergillus wentii]OJJ34058.1 hypothetical protein ASPWEDRAFT_173492 [Aspergillus wentii DTO 134E9]